MDRGISRGNMANGLNDSDFCVAQNPDEGYLYALWYIVNLLVTGCCRLLEKAAGSLLVRSRLVDTVPQRRKKFLGK